MSKGPVQINSIHDYKFVDPRAPTKKARYAPTPKGVKAAWDIYNQMVKIERARCVDIIQKEINAAIDDGETSLFWHRLSKAKARIIAGEKP